MKEYLKPLAFMLVLLNFSGLGLVMAEAHHKAPPSKETFTELRMEMISEQIAKRGVKDPRVLSAMKKVERHRFVPPDLVEGAYKDYPLPIGFNQTISQPYIVALMSELLHLTGSERVLEIGTGSGYQAAILGELAHEVYTIEIIPDLAQKAEKTLTALGYQNVHVKTADGYKGWQEEAPFDGIIVTCSPEHIPPPLVDQLKEGGRMVIPVGDFPNQMLYVAQKKDGSLHQKKIAPVAFVPMTGEAQRKKEGKENP